MAKEPALSLSKGAPALAAAIAVDHSLMNMRILDDSHPAAPALQERAAAVDALAGPIFGGSLDNRERQGDNRQRDRFLSLFWFANRL
jgi:hypothetical protein